MQDHSSEVLSIPTHFDRLAVVVLQGEVPAQTHDVHDAIIRAAANVFLRCIDAQLIHTCLV